MKEEKVLKIFENAWILDEADELTHGLLAKELFRGEKK